MLCVTLFLLLGPLHVLWDLHQMAALRENVINNLFNANVIKEIKNTASKKLHQTSKFPGCKAFDLGQTKVDHQIASQLHR
jgi:hypothetical protein